MFLNATQNRLQNIFHDHIGVTQKKTHTLFLFLRARIFFGFSCVTLKYKVILQAII